MRGNRVLNNVKWVVICKTVQSVTQLVIGMLTARYLGPDNYAVGSGYYIDQGIG